MFTGKKLVWLSQHKLKPQYNLALTCLTQLLLLVRNTSCPGYILGQSASIFHMSWDIRVRQGGETTSRSIEDEVCYIQILLIPKKQSVQCTPRQLTGSRVELWENLPHVGQTFAGEVRLLSRLLSATFLVPGEDILRAKRWLCQHICTN